MEFSQTINQRYSCRKFLDKAVDLDTLQDLISLASRVPSWGNTQPWKIYAAAGETARAIRAEITGLFLGNEPQAPDIPMPRKFDSPLMDRYRKLGAELLTSLGIARDDKQRRDEHFANNFDAFSAPALVFWTIPQGETPYLAFDCGGMVSAFCLAATEAGLGSIVQATLAYYPQVIRKHLPIPDEERLLIGAALGYPDPEARVNQFRSKRAGLDEVLKTSGF